MGLFRRKGKAKNQKVFVLGLDGAPFSLMNDYINRGLMPNFAKLITQGTFKQMKSIIPTISSVAWSSFMTGCNPGKHNIHGFVDRKPNPFEIFIPTARNMKTSTLWEILSNAGKKVIVINVPVTYPPKEVNGILISGFLATDIEKATYPKDISRILKENGYIIDVNPGLAHKDKDKFKIELLKTLEKRVETIYGFLEREKWDFFICQIMETDRLHHFVMDEMNIKDEEGSNYFINFYQRIDTFIGELVRKLPDDIVFIILSDHGFCQLKKEIQLNYFLEQKSWLIFKKGEKRTFENMAEETRAYSLIPGRIFINIKNREQMGSVDPHDEYRDVMERLKTDLFSLLDPETKEKIIKEVIPKEKLYKGYYHFNAPDMVAVPNDGYDLKAKLDIDNLTTKGPINGMHTYEDALFYIRNHEINREDISIMDPMPTILEIMGVEIPGNIDGKPLI